jgi:hypothetical protein
MGFFRSVYDKVKNKINSWMKPGGSIKTVYDDIKQGINSGVSKIKSVFDTVNGVRKFAENVPFVKDIVKPYAATFDNASELIDNSSNLISRGMRIGDDIVNRQPINNQSVDILKRQGSSILDNISKLKTNLLNRRQK